MRKQSGGQKEDVKWNWQAVLKEDCQRFYRYNEEKGGWGTDVPLKINMVV